MTKLKLFSKGNRKWLFFVNKTTGNKFFGLGVRWRGLCLIKVDLLGSKISIMMHKTRCFKLIIHTANSLFFNSQFQLSFETRFSYHYEYLKIRQIQAKTYNHKWDNHKWVHKRKFRTWRIYPQNSKKILI